jgi:hypothetical protein
LGKYLNVNSKCIQIIPKKEHCRHYDGYMHTYSVINDYVSADRVPPLFIPNGFFENDIQIKYGYDKYFLDFTNINPNSQSYIFSSKAGTDLGNLISKIPLFWKDRISHIDINPVFLEPKSEDISLAKRIINPWENYSYWRVKTHISFRKCNFLFKGSALGIFISRVKFACQKK